MDFLVKGVAAAANISSYSNRCDAPVPFS